MVSAGEHAFPRVAEVDTLENRRSSGMLLTSEENLVDLISNSIVHIHPLRPYKPST